MLIDPIRCRVCGSDDCEDCGPPAYHLPTKVAGVAIDLSDLHLVHARCRSCEYRFVHPPIPEERLLEAYRRSASNNWTTDASVAAARNYRHKGDLLRRYVPSGRVLDFGCYDGGFLSVLGAEYAKFGIEPAEWAARQAAEKGVSVLGPTIQSLNPTIEPFDAIIAFDVMEHLNHPIEVLQALARLLKPSGIVLIETGNSDCRPWRSQGKRYPYCGPPEHVGFFNRSSITRSAPLAGLKLDHFEESVHTAWPLRWYFTHPMYVIAYRAIRLAQQSGVSLSARGEAIAGGPVPRSTNPKDHFLAVFRQAGTAAGAPNSPAWAATERCESPGRGG